jgi:hypothetical protein
MAHLWVIFEIPLNGYFEEFIPFVLVKCADSALIVQIIEIAKYGIAVRRPSDSISRFLRTSITPADSLYETGKFFALTDGKGDACDVLR